MMRSFGKAVITAVGITLLFISCDKEKVAEATTTTTVELEKVELVKVQILEKELIIRQLEFSSILQGYEEMAVSPAVMGKIEKIHKNPGATVRKGDLLITMDQNQLISARLSFSNLKVELSRLEVLKESGTVSQQSFDNIKVQYDQAKANLAFLEKNTFVRADFSGVITEKYFEQGEYYTGGRAILDLGSVRVLRTYISVPEKYYPVLTQGQTVQVHSDLYPNTSFPAKIEMVFPSVDPATHTFKVKLRIPNASEVLRAGMYVKSQLGMGTTDAILVPYQAVLKLIGSNNRYVFLDVEGKAKRVDVKIGERFDDMVEITSDQLKIGDKLVVLGQGRLIDGVSLRIAK